MEAIALSEFAIYSTVLVAVLGYSFMIDEIKDAFIWPDARTFTGLGESLKLLSSLVGMALTPKVSTSFMTILLGYLSVE